MLFKTSVIKCPKGRFLCAPIMKVVWRNHDIFHNDTRILHVKYKNSSKTNKYYQKTSAVHNFYPSHTTSEP